MMEKLPLIIQILSFSLFFISSSFTIMIKLIENFKKNILNNMQNEINIINLKISYIQNKFNEIDNIISLKLNEIHNKIKYIENEIYKIQSILILIQSELSNLKSHSNKEKLK